MRSRIILLALFLLADRLLKNYIWFKVYMPDGGNTSFFIRPILNNNISFSIQVPVALDNFINPILIAIIIAVAYYAVRLYRRGSSVFFWWGCIGVGALSNALDRIQLGGVLDYIDVGYWPVFNTSDMYITVGVIMIIAGELFGALHVAKK